MSPFLNLYKKYKDKAEVEFINVYINEAHADDRWRFNGNTKIDYHKSLNDRFEAFKIMFGNIVQLIENDDECNIESIKDLNKMKFMLDSMQKFNNLDYAFNAYPERFVAFKDGRVAHKFGGPGPVVTIINKKYDVKELERYLSKYFDE